ncbi:MAG: hypothetical protein KF774_22085 [Planctomyces sp.]|nr:hypothetical protein [Planctomyces sp.]
MNMVHWRCIGSLAVALAVLCETARARAQFVIATPDSAAVRAALEMDLSGFDQWDRDFITNDLAIAAAMLGEFETAERLLPSREFPYREQTCAVIALACLEQGHTELGMRLYNDGVETEPARRAVLYWALARSKAPKALLEVILRSVPGASESARTRLAAIACSRLPDAFDAAEQGRLAERLGGSLEAVEDEIVLAILFGWATGNESLADLGLQRLESLPDREHAAYCSLGISLLHMQGDFGRAATLTSRFRNGLDLDRWMGRLLSDRVLLPGSDLAKRLVAAIQDSQSNSADFRDNLLIRAHAMNGDMAAAAAVFRERTKQPSTWILRGLTKAIQELAMRGRRELLDDVEPELLAALKNRSATDRVLALSSLSLSHRLLGDSTTADERFDSAMTVAGWFHAADRSGDFTEYGLWLIIAEACADAPATETVERAWSLYLTPTAPESGYSRDPRVNGGLAFRAERLLARKLGVDGARQHLNALKQQIAERRTIDPEDDDFVDPWEGVSAYTVAPLCRSWIEFELHAMRETSPENRASALATGLREFIRARADLQRAYVEGPREFPSAYYYPH